ncbi:MAG: hypothetical protein HY700_16225 [Gemmatimonadetes bacterium]|nr:hypothetical protein [Gemmatimonadota bacterium]
MLKAFARTGVTPLVTFAVSALLAGAVACAGRAPGEVSPQEIPDLQARVAQEPGNAALLSRYSAALLSANQCDSARVVANRAVALNPADAVATLVVGQCLERAGQYQQAIAGYRRFAAQQGKAQGVGAVRGRELIAKRDQASAAARDALRREQELAQIVADPRTIAVLPMEIVGDTSYQPLSRGLAQMIISDLGLLQRFNMVERVQIGAIMDEIKFGQAARVDPATAARVGHLVQAGRLVYGVTTIPATGPIRMQANVVQGTGEVGDAGQANGTLRELLRMEKDLVVQLVGRLGYTLSEAERRTILENGTQNIQAFLAYSRGLLAEDAGDYSRAALYYGEAVQADPNFQAAREQQQAAAAAPAAQTTQVTTAVVQAQAVSQPPPPPPPALTSTVGDLAPTQSEQTSAGSDHSTTQQAGNTTTSDPNTTTTSSGTTETVTGTVNIRFRLP